MVKSSLEAILYPDTSHKLITALYIKIHEEEEKRQQWGQDWTIIWYSRTGMPFSTAQRTIKYIRAPSTGFLKHMAEGGNTSEVCKRTADCRIVHCLFSMRTRAPPKKLSNGMFKIWIGHSENYFFTEHSAGPWGPLTNAVRAKRLHEFYSWLVKFIEEKSVKGY